MLHRHLLLFLFGALVWTGCEGKKFDLPVPELKDVLPGGNLLAQVGEARLEIDPTVRDPLTGLGACTDLLTYCFEPGAKSLDACVQEVRRCSSKEPWKEEACCPESCVKAYERGRESVEPSAAFETAFFAGESCYPGVKEMLR